MRQSIIDRISYVFALIAVIGIAIIIAFFARRARDRSVQLKVIREYENRLAMLNKEGLDHNSYISSNEYKALDGETLAILSLDRLNIKVSVAEGIASDTLRISAGHFEETAMPGEGNFSIAGHSSMIYTCLFNSLHKAVVGDIINVTSTNGKHSYIVSEIITVDPTDMEYLDNTNESVITIVTCTNSGKNRLIIRGIEI